MNRPSETADDRTKQLFLSCQFAPSETQRDRLLAEADPEVADHVRRLLDAVPVGEIADQTFDLPDLPQRSVQDLTHRSDFDCVSPPTRDDTSREQAGTVIGNYKLLEQIGEGGMGTVFMAQQTRPVKRRVAVKIVKAGMDTRQVVARFEAERQALALMDHPNIARVFDGGSTQAGRPYFVMELVRGLPITAFCQQKGIELRDRLGLFIDVCRGVLHAHQRGIIHRDLKPSNVLVTLHDDEPVVKIIDFGIAKATNQELTDKTLFTQFTAMVGTPLYMSPEQAELSGLDVDTRSDVYSLGVMLYELMTDTTPFDRATLDSKGIDEVRRMIRETDPPRPSQRISTAKATDDATIHIEKVRETQRRQSILRGELDWIAMRALEKKRERRYQSAAELADDVRRYLDGDAVQACPPSVVYRVRKYARRHRVLLTTIGLVLLTAMAGTAASLRYAAVANDAKSRAVVALADAKRSADIAEEKTVQAEAAEADAKSARDSQEAARLEAEKSLYVSDMRLANGLIERGDLSLAVNHLIRHAPRPGKRDLRGWEWYKLMSEVSTSEKTWETSIGNVTQVVQVPGEPNVMLLSKNRTLKINLDNETVESVPYVGRLLCYGPSGDEWATVQNLTDITLHHKSGAQERLPESRMTNIASLAWHPSGNRIAVGGQQAIEGATWQAKQPMNLVVYERADSNSPWFIVHEEHRLHPVIGVNWTSNPSRLNILVFTDRSYSLDGDIYQNSKPLSEYGAIRHSAHAGSNIAAFGYDDGNISLYDLNLGQTLKRWRAHAGGITLLAMSPDGTKLASTGTDGCIRVWSVKSQELLREFHEHSPLDARSCWTSDSKSLLSTDRLGVCHLWSAERGEKEPASSAVEQPFAEGFAWVGEHTLRRLTDDGKLIDKDLISGSQRSKSVTMPSGNWVLRDPEWATESIKTGTRDMFRAIRLGERHATYSASFNPDSPALGTCQFLPLDSNSRVLTIAGHSSLPKVFDIATNSSDDLANIRFACPMSHDLHPERELVALGGFGPSPSWRPFLVILKSKDLSILHRFAPVRFLTQGVTACRFSPNGDRIAVGYSGGVCQVFTVPEMQLQTTWQQGESNINEIAWHPQGNRVASGSNASQIYVWDPLDGATVIQIPVDEPVTKIEWSPDGQFLCLSKNDGMLDVKDASHGYRPKTLESAMTRDRNRLLVHYEASHEGMPAAHLKSGLGTVEQQLLSLEAGGNQELGQSSSRNSFSRIQLRRHQAAILHRVGRYREAFSIAESFLSGDDPNVDWLVMLVGPATALENDREYLTRFREALESFRSGLKQSSTLDNSAVAEALNSAAWKAVEGNQTSAPYLAIAELAVELSDSNPMMVDTLAWNHFLLGNVEKAIELERQAIAKLRADDPDAEIDAAYTDALATFEAAKQTR